MLRKMFFQGLVAAAIVAGFAAAYAAAADYTPGQEPQTQTQASVAAAQEPATDNGYLKMANPAYSKKHRDEHHDRKHAEKNRWFGAFGGDRDDDDED